VTQTFAVNQQGEALNILGLFILNRFRKFRYEEVVDLQEMNTMLYETIQNWYKEAEVRGKAELVIDLLESKFGVLPASIRATIAHLDSETLLKCSQRLFTAKTVQEVIEPSLSRGAST
jgi:hypothetical protein